MKTSQLRWWLKPVVVGLLLLGAAGLGVVLFLHGGQAKAHDTPEVAGGPDRGPGQDDPPAGGPKLPDDGGSAGQRRGLLPGRDRGPCGRRGRVDRVAPGPR